MPPLPAYTPKSLAWLLLVLIVLGSPQHRLARAAQLSEPGALAQRPQGQVPVEPDLLPNHLRARSESAAVAAADPLRPRSRRTSSAHAAPLPEAIRGVRFNAPPPARQRTLAGHEEPTSEVPDRSGGLGGFELSPLVIAITVDGQVHALERETGQWRWTLHDDGGVALSGLGRGSGHERQRRSSAGAAVGGPLVKSASRRRRAVTNATASNETGIGPALEDDDDDEQYIIEPTGDGDIYVYSRSSGGLDKLPLSMQELVNLSPFRFPGDASRMFSASKNTKFVGVDLKTGRLVGVFGSSAGWCEWDEADELLTGGAAKSAEQDCEDDIAMRPQDLLYMARTEYHLSIYDTTSSQPLQTLSYTTYSSSTLPHVAPVTSGTSGEHLSQATWTRTPDSLYLQPMHDGSLVCFRAGKPGIFWTIDFEAPVVSVFDVLVPAASSEASSSSVDPSENDSDERHPIMFEQPHPLLVPDLPLDFALLQREPAATFVGRVPPAVDQSHGATGSKGGELFAMSRDRFPLVPFAQVAEIAQGESGTGGDGDGEHSPREAGDGEGEAPASPKPCRGLDCLIGRHRLLHPPPPSPIGIDATLDPGSPEPLLLEGGDDGSDSKKKPSPSSPHSGGRNDSPQAPHRRSPHLPGSSTLLSRFYESSVRELSGQGEKSSGKLTVGVLLVVLAIWWWTKIRKTASAPPPSKIRYSNGVSTSSPENSADASPNSVNGAARETSKSRQRSPSSPPTPTKSDRPIAVRRRSSSVSLMPAATISAVSKELPPLPPAVPSIEGAADPAPPASLAKTGPSTQGNGDGDDGDSDSGALDGAAGPGTPPRKRNRRRRGAKKKKPKEGAAGPGDELGDDRDLLEGITLSERDTREGDGELSAQVDWSGHGVDGERADGSAPKSTQVASTTAAASPRDASQFGNGLSVSETILGYGSHGTVVLRGEFQGRAVAVKRLLKDFVTIATHEVNLLQESDDHPHVIRYFCKEQRDTFLYIALELCPASLFDLIDQPATYPELVAQLDPKKALKQIASGLRHLHSLKIVHRDIKPQNILVSTAKRGQPGLRMLISDFGLCKKLDVDESSFQQTMNHAAGSFGYRAPEVLRGLVDPNETANGASGLASLSGSTGSGGSSSTLAGVTSTDPSMRLTRSIDIFSLGCIFYFLLTGGEHPFGGRYEREMNILQGKASLDRLDGLGEEAVEVQDLILRMVATDPRERPTADAVLLHPFFWNAQKRLLFLCDASDRFEIMERDPPAPTLITLEKRSRSIVGDDWQKALDRTFLDNLGKYRKYDGSSVRDLLRVLRNKKHHYQDLPENVRRALGDLPGGFLTYFTARFPHLLLHVYDTVAVHLADEAMFSSTFRIPEDEG